MPQAKIDFNEYSVFNLKDPKALSFEQLLNKKCESKIHSRLNKTFFFELDVHKALPR